MADIHAFFCFPKGEADQTRGEVPEGATRKLVLRPRRPRHRDDNDLSVHEPNGQGPKANGKEGPRRWLASVVEELGPPVHY